MKPKIILNPNDIVTWLCRLVAPVSLSNEVKRWFINNGRKYIATHADLEKVKYFINDKDAWWMREAAIAGESFFVFKPYPYLESILTLLLIYIKNLPKSESILGSTLPDALGNALKWANKAKYKKRIEEDPEGIRNVLSFEDGFFWVQLDSEKALIREGELMGHCVAEYFEDVEMSQVRIFSLRDSKNKPHVTLEFASSRVVQMKARFNKPMPRTYLKYVVSLMKDMGSRCLMFDEFFHKRKKIKTIDCFRHLNEQGLFIGQEYVAHIFELPDYFEYSGDMDFRSSLITRLPLGLKVDGNLILEASNIKRLPKELKIKGVLDLRSTKLQSVPSDLFVGEMLILSKSGIRSLPEGLTIDGSLDLTFTQISSLPKNLTVKDNLFLTGSKVRWLPEGLRVGGRIVY